MKLSLAIITHNRKNEILYALESCIKFITSDMEIVIIDNNSKDGTQKAIESYMNNYTVNYKYYYSENNLGVAGGRNLAFQKSIGEYIFFLDDDAIVVTDDIFNKVCKFLDIHHSVAAIGLNIYEPKTDTYLLNVIRDCKKDYHLMYSFIGAGHVIRKSFFSTSEVLYPARLQFGSEELYASLRIWSKGKDIAYVPEFKIHHIPSVINRYNGKERDFNILLNSYIIKKLVYPNYILPIVSTMFMLRVLKNGLWTKEWRIRIKRELAKRYDKNERFKISIKKIIYLAHTFKLKDVL